MTCGTRRRDSTVRALAKLLLGAYVCGPAATYAQVETGSCDLSFRERILWLQEALGSGVGRCRERSADELDLGQQKQHFRISSADAQEIVGRSRHVVPLFGSKPKEPLIRVGSPVGDRISSATRWLPTKRWICLGGARG